MERSFWSERWDTGQIGFHAPTPNPHLVAHGERLGPPSQVLVPLCGKSVDLAWLADRGWQVTGVEFVERAARDFFAERGRQPRTRTAGAAPALEADGVTIVVSDFFEAALSPFPAIWDRAALIAVEPSRRRAYLERLRALATDEARLLLVTADHDLPAGPPFSVSAAELAALAAGLFTFERLGSADVLASEPRLCARGATRMIEEVWLGRPQPGVRPTAAPR